MMEISDTLSSFGATLLRLIMTFLFYFVNSHVVQEHPENTPTSSCLIKHSLCGIFSRHFFSLEVWFITIMCATEYHSNMYHNFMIYCHFAVRQLLPLFVLIYFMFENNNLATLQKINAGFVFQYLTKIVGKDQHLFAIFFCFCKRTCISEFNKSFNFNLSLLSVHKMDRQKIF